MVISSPSSEPRVSTKSIVHNSQKGLVEWMPKLVLRASNLNGIHTPQVIVAGNGMYGEETERPRPATHLIV